MVAAAKVVSNGAIESALSIAKRLAGVDRQRMTAASLQYSFICAENVAIAAPLLRVLIHRWVNGRKHGAGAFLYGSDPVERSALPSDIPPEALDFVCERRAKFARKFNFHPFVELPPLREVLHSRRE
jgi:hypothetical protein